MLTAERRLKSLGWRRLVLLNIPVTGFQIFQRGTFGNAWGLLSRPPLSGTIPPTSSFNFADELYTHCNTSCIQHTDKPCLFFFCSLPLDQCSAPVDHHDPSSSASFSSRGFSAGAVTRPTQQEAVRRRSRGSSLII